MYVCVYACLLLKLFLWISRFFTCFVPCPLHFPWVRLPDNNRLGPKYNHHKILLLNAMCPEQWPCSHTILWQSALIASRWAQQHYTICEHATKALSPHPPPACFGGKQCILILVLKVGRANSETQSPLLLFPVLWRRGCWLYEHLLAFSCIQTVLTWYHSDWQVTSYLLCCPSLLLTAIV